MHSLETARPFRQRTCDCRYPSQHWTDHRNDGSEVFLGAPMLTKQISQLTLQQEEPTKLQADQSLIWHAVVDKCRAHAANVLLQRVVCPFLPTVTCDLAPRTHSRLGDKEPQSQRRKSEWRHAGEPSDMLESLGNRGCCAGTRHGKSLMMSPRRCANWEWLSAKECPLLTTVHDVIAACLPAQLAPELVRGPDEPRSEQTARKPWLP